MSEVQAIFEDLEHRRLRAILDQDEDAYRSVFANEYYEEASIAAMNLVTVSDPAGSRILISEILVDKPDCIATNAEVDHRASVVDGGVSSFEWVIQRVGRNWGFSWAGEGWLCEGSHPLAP